MNFSAVLCGALLAATALFLALPLFFAARRRDLS
jgi:hypothetical protein